MFLNALFSEAIHFSIILSSLLFAEINKITKIINLMYLETYFGKICGEKWSFSRKVDNL
jgi:hypothetical protein